MTENQVNDQKEDNLCVFEKEESYFKENYKLIGVAFGTYIIFVDSK